MKLKWTMLVLLEVQKAQEQWCQIAEQAEIRVGDRVISPQKEFIRCACRKGQIAGYLNGTPNCVDERTIDIYGWCHVKPCPRDEKCVEIGKYYECQKCDEPAKV